MPSLNGFNASEVGPAADFEPIAPGSYTAVITESETKPTKAGTGSYLQFTFQIVDGEHKGRLLWARLNLDNPSEGCDLDYVPHTARDVKIDAALSNSFGFGGTNGTVIFRKL